MVPVVVVLPAEIDVTTSEQVHDLLVAALAPGVDIVIADMTGTSFCDSSGVHAIVFAHETVAARGAKMIGVGRILPVYPTLQEAMDAQ